MYIHAYTYIYTYIYIYMYMHHAIYIYIYIHKYLCIHINNYTTNHNDNTYALPLGDFPAGARWGSGVTMAKAHLGQI